MSASARFSRRETGRLTASREGVADETMASEPVVRLRHGTTRRRAEAILLHGPDPKFREPGGQPDPPDIGGFSTAVSGVDCVTGNPDEVAVRKSRLFPDEGGPAIVHMEVPRSVCELAINVGSGEIRFQPGYGLAELLDCWADLQKTIELL
jgi:hypothetical protein